MTSKATTVEEYISGLPDGRKQSLETIRAAILEALQPGYVEGIQYGMITYSVPHSIYPAGYHCDPKQPVMFIGLGNQKGHIGIYLFCLYINPDDKAKFAADWTATGKKLDMGGACVRVKSSDAVPLEVLKVHIAMIPVETFLNNYQTLIPESKKKKK